MLILKWDECLWMFIKRFTFYKINYHTTMGVKRENANTMQV